METGQHDAERLCFLFQALMSGVKCSGRLNYCLNRPVCLPSPPILSSMIDSLADKAVSSLQERRSMLRLDFIAELMPGCTLLISLTIWKSDVFTSQMMNSSIKAQVAQSMRLELHQFSVEVLWRYAFIDALV